MDAAGNAPDMEGMFAPPAPSDRLTLGTDLPERDLLKDSLHASLGAGEGRGLSMELVKVDDTGMYSVIDQLTKKVEALDEQCRNPAWFKSVMENMGRVDEVERKVDGVVESMERMKGTLEVLSRKILGEEGVEGGGGEGVKEEREEKEGEVTEVTGADEEKKSEETTELSTDPASADSASPPPPSSSTLASSNALLTKDLAAANSRIASLRKEMKQRDDNARLEVDAKVGELSMQNTRLLGKMQADFPSVEEFRQFKVFSEERAKQLKMAMQQRAVDAQRSVDDKLNTEMEKIMKWKETFSTTTMDRLRSVEDLVRSFKEDLTYLRGGVDEHVHSLEERIDENQRWTQKKFTESSAEVKKMMKATHEVGAQVREQGAALDEDRRRMSGIVGQISDVKEEAFGQTMELKMAVEQIAEADLARDLEIEKNFMANIELESRLVGHDLQIESQLETLDGHGERLETLATADEAITSDLAILRRDELGSTNDQLKLLMDSTDKELEDIKNGRLKKMAEFCERMHLHLAEVSNDVKVFPEQIKGLVKETNGIWSDIEETKAKAAKHSTLTNSVLERIVDVEESTTAIKFLKDKSVTLAEDLASMRTETSCEIEDLRKGEAVMRKVVAGQGVLEKRLVQQIGEARGEAQRILEERVGEVQEQVRAVQDKTEGVVRQVLQSQAASDGAKGGRHRRNSGEGGGGSSGSVRKNSVLGMSMEDVMDHEEEVAENVAELVMEFEEHCNKKTFVTDIPSDVREKMATLSQEMAEFIASKSDQEAIIRVLRGAAGEVQYTDEEIEASRVTTLYQWMRQVLTKVESTGPKRPNIIKSEAREKIVKKMSDAIDMAMSKHDQVLITGHSRLGRVQLPSCIACDRPLAKKKRFKEMRGKEEELEQLEQRPLQSGGKSMKLPDYKEIEHTPDISRMETLRPETAGQLREYEGGGQLVRRPGTAELGGGGGGKRPIFGGGPGGTGAQQFVYRGGFKMPKGGGMSGMVVNGMIGADSLPNLHGGGGGGHVF